jgi:redox-sensitive bicupin YhaK (pirin superfamily)
MKDFIIHKAGSRGHAENEWLSSYQTFSFSKYYHPERIQFGALRVLNDDTVAGGKGFGSHPHDNMEIISIPLEGALEHRDNLGNTGIIRKGDIQVMTTGTGVFHSEVNADPEQPVKFLQIWIFPKQLNVKPRYEQITLDRVHQVNQLQQIVSPYPEEEGCQINQDAWFSMGTFERSKTARYNARITNNGLYFFVINGSFKIEGQKLDSRDGMGIPECGPVNIESLEDNSTILIMDIPMKADQQNM